MSLFDGIYLLDETHLGAEFSTRFKDRLKLGSRGYGYWIWKPYIIANTLGTMSEGDSLLYLDAGCHLNIEGKKRLIEYFELLKESKTGILAFQENSPNTKLKHDGRQLHDRPNYHWIKGDVFDYFGVREDPDFTHAQSFTAGIILVRKCKAAVEIIDEWQSITTSNFSLLTRQCLLSEAIKTTPS